MRKCALLGAVGTAVALGFVAGSARASVVYTESFPASTSNTSHDAIGWSAYTSSGVGNVVDSSLATGSPDKSLFVATSTGSGGVTGIGAKQTTGVSGLIYTSEFGTYPLSDLTNLSFSSNNSSSTGGVYRIAIRVDSAGTLGNVADDTWYATDATYSSSGGSPTNWTTNASSHDLVFAPTGATWRTLTFIPTGPSQQITVGSAGSVTTDLAGTLTAAGLYMSENTGITLRYDNFQIAAVPEPTSIGAVVITGMALLRRRNRRDR